MTETRHRSDEHVDDLLPLYALDALDEIQSRRVREHLLVCIGCAGEYAVWAERAADLNTSAEPVPDSVRARLMDAVDRESGDQRGPRRWTRWAAAACIVMAAGAGGAVAWHVVTGHAQTVEQSADGAMRDVLAAPDMQKSTGTLGAGNVAAMYSPSQRATVVTVEDLPPTEQAMGYQVWISVDGRMKSAGVVPADDRSSVVMTDMGRPAGVSLSVEPMSGSPEPTSPMVVQVPMP
ncbi:anti-sigma factor [Gordonia neofelifaecis]|uniref:Regulator of SigK n=1 Tax=Gordonia neofelifaecis NRRL B-59395 TaxID=644548 RepID=F1YFY7_9ACTN|nr:anti-sigma factor [Gordonia neofelifaecis]EGD56564.1 hypothetical protein SCNU_03397 [Gordonia neofelifaecis NRRL B-59395]